MTESPSRAWGVSVDPERFEHGAADEPLTLLVCAMAMLVSWLLAVPIGALAALRQGRTFDVVSTYS